MMILIAYFFIFVIYLCLGSFLNVLIYRSIKKISILHPRSYCPSCRYPIRWQHNIPVISFLWLRGRCAYCRQKISWRYPVVELITAVAGIILYHQFCFHSSINSQFILASFFSFTLIILIFIDLETQLLPDLFTLSLLWIGLLANTQFLFTSPSSAIIGAAAGYLSLWCIAMLYEKYSGIEGMGYGDFKLFAALGAWTGWQPLSNIALISSLSGLAIGLYLMLYRKAHARTQIAFGPYLAIAGWIVLIFPSLFK